MTLPAHDDDYSGVGPPSGSPGNCPPGTHRVSSQCVPDGPAGGGNAPGPGNCPAGQVWHGWPPPGRCEAEDALSKAGQDTCNEAEHPQEPHPDCYWCEFATQQWRRGMCPGEGGGRGSGGTGGVKSAGGGGGSSFGGAFPATPYEFMLAAMQGQLGDTLNRIASSIFGVSFPAFSEGVNYYRTLLGKGGRGAMQAATAPAAEQIAAGAEGAVRSLGTGYLRGGARDEAEASIRRGASGDIAHLTQGVQPGAADRLIAAGQGGVSQATGAVQGAAGIYGNLANLAVSSRLSTEGMSLQKELGLKGLQLQRDLGFANLGYQYAALAQSGAQFEKSFGLQQALGFGGLQLSYDQLAQGASQFQQTIRLQQQQIKQQGDQAKWGGLGSLIGTLGGAAIGASSARVKEQVEEPAPAAEGLRRILAEALPALRGWRYTREAGAAAGLSVDAGLVLELAPRYGALADADFPSGRVLNLPQLLGDLLGAVGELARRNEELERRLDAMSGGGGHARR